MAVKQSTHLRTVPRFKCVQLNGHTSTPDNIGREVREISAGFKKSAIKGTLCTTFFDTEDSTFYQQSELLSLHKQQLINLFNFKALWTLTVLCVV